MKLMQSSYSLPLVPMRDMVIYPNTYAPFYVGRQSSIMAVKNALSSHDKLIFLSAQKDAKIDNPSPDDIYSIGVIAKIIQYVDTETSNLKVIVEGIQRAKILKYDFQIPFFQVEVSPLEYEIKVDNEIRRYMDMVLSLAKKFAKLSQNSVLEAMLSSLSFEDVSSFCDRIASALKIETSEKQVLLETLNPITRLQKINDILDIEIEKINIDKRINQKVRKQMEKAQKEYYLTEKIKAIHDELGQAEDRTLEIQELKKKIEECGMTPEAKEKALYELKRLESMAYMSAEATVSRTYIDWLINVPWKKATREIKDLKRAEKILNEDHYGLEKIKERILEFLAVRQLVKKSTGSILCFVGPPGVGKTSLGRSIARAMNRKFVRLSLGGVRDEAEIRGHRRTYIGALPGQIIQMMKKAGTINPVMLLDEIDKMSMDFRGDPSAALMEVLDPEQNKNFNDHYLDVDYNLSHVFFICTANVLHSIPPALRDRMEILQLAGYTDMEKIEIAKRHLIPKQLKHHGLSKYKIEFTDEGIMTIIENFTREAGVRNLEREISSICRKLAKILVRDKELKYKTLGKNEIFELLGKPKFRRLDPKLEKPKIGVALGLAWTEVGGELLATEAVKMPGKGNLILTGQLGEVMQESAKAALSWIRSKSLSWDLDPEFFQKYDIHIHVPEGAIPKDGPSAGITLGVALASLVRDIPVRMDMAMTGEITLIGKVLPVGGIKEKILGAHRSGILNIILPKENEKDLEDIPKEVLEKLKVHLVENMEEVISLALLGEEEVALKEEKAKALSKTSEKQIPLPEI
ncbi:MAG: endopeptidase La [Thermoanaerobaculia bacterium]